MMDHSEVLAWLKGELYYADQKRASRADDDADMARRQLKSVFGNDFSMYLGRAQVLGLETPNGRQALGKAVAVSIAALESATRVFGSLPPAGMPSGETDAE